MLHAWTYSPMVKDTLISDMHSLIKAPFRVQQSFL